MMMMSLIGVMMLMYRMKLQMMHHKLREKDRRARASLLE